MSSALYAASIGTEQGVNPSANTVRLGTTLHGYIIEELASRKNLASLPPGHTGRTFRQTTAEGVLFVTIEVAREVDESVLEAILIAGGKRMLRASNEQFLLGVREYRNALERLAAGAPLRKE